MIRVLVSCRLSQVIGHEAGEGDRIEWDKKAAQEWCDRQGDRVIIGTAIDESVSGDKDPFHRPGLGPWLTEPHLLREYEEIIASDVDRLGRNTWDSLVMRQWCKDHGKRLVILSKGLVWPPTDPGMEFQWDLFSALAADERWKVIERTDRMRRARFAVGSMVGRAPYGFRIVGKQGDKTLEVIPELDSVLREMVDRAVQGQTMGDITRWLNSTDAKPMHAGKITKRQVGAGSDDGRWSEKSVWQLLHNPVLKGERRGKHPETGKQVLWFTFPSLLTPGEFLQLEKALAKRPQRGGRPATNTERTKPLLTGIICCNNCGQKMYRTISRPSKTSPELHYYYCRSYECSGKHEGREYPSNMVPVDEADAFISAWFGDGPYSLREILETKLTRGTNHEDEIAEVDAEIRTVAQDPTAPDFLERLTNLQAERLRLAALPVEPDRIETIPTGDTVGSIWPTLSDEQRSAFLKRSTKVWVRPKTPGDTASVNIAPNLENMRPEDVDQVREELFRQAAWLVTRPEVRSERTVWTVQFDGKLEPGAVLRNVLDKAQ